MKVPGLLPLKQQAGLSFENWLFNIRKTLVLETVWSNPSPYGPGRALQGMPALCRFAASMNPITILISLSLNAVDGDTVKCDGVNLRPMGNPRRRARRRPY